MSYCTKCGNHLKSDARFCGKCGENITLPSQDISSVNSAKPSFKEALVQFSSSFEEFTMPNSQQRIVNLWLLLGAFFIFLIFLPSIIGLDGFDGGFAISFVSGFKEDALRIVDHFQIKEAL